MRTNEKIIMAQNPSDALHWSLAYKAAADCLYLHSTYKDNPFLPEAIVRQIESYKDTDLDQWNIYGLGLPAKNSELVYTQYQFWHSEDDLYEIDGEGKRHEKFGDVVIGLDWGYQHPSAVVKIWIDDNYRRIWIKELIHESFLTTDDLIKKMKDLQISDIKMYGDSAEPKTIESVRRAGFDIEPANKEVREGIDCVKSYKMFVHSESVKIQDELRRYKWKLKGEMRTDEPIKLFDDGLCATRYALYTWVTRRKRQQSWELDIEII